MADSESHLPGVIYKRGWTAINNTQLDSRGYCSIVARVGRDDADMVGEMQLRGRKFACEHNFFNRVNSTYPPLVRNTSIGKLSIVLQLTERS
jgi:hypothetical protein